MTNIVDSVWKILDNSPDITRNLSLGLINIRALAKYFVDKQDIPGTVDAVISAIRRYDIKKQNAIFSRALAMIKDADSISTMSNLANISLVKDTEIQKLIPRFFEIIQYQHGDVLRIIQADGAIKVLINEKNLEKIQKILPSEKIIHIDRNLAEINIHQNPNAKKTPGILAVMTNELANHGISVYEVLTCFPEMLWFVDQQHLLESYSILYDLINPQT